MEDPSQSGWAGIGLLVLALLTYWVAFLGPVVFRSLDTRQVRWRLVCLAGAVCLLVFGSTLLYFGGSDPIIVAPDWSVHVPGSAIPQAAESK
jgi:hypothetical protein